MKVDDSKVTSGTKIPTESTSNNTRTGAYAERIIAQSPALVSMNNEPIPHKRHRRQPTIIDNASVAAKVRPTKKAAKIDINSNEKPADKYTKKVPKPAIHSTDNAVAKAPESVKASSAKSDKSAQIANKQEASNQNMSSQIDANKIAISNATANKGPVPSKRRRRQPSTGDM